ncbi:MAG: neutral/alkaline non-lysosomal ceramidase N-terminal domain-containing protein [Nitrospirae bacterium]|nr:neutral/alkaline non-lysosomal ceramidase N-terminal domain-containing protein [Nitrospirota bacterium]
MRAAMIAAAWGVVACLPIDRTPVESTPAFRTAVAETERIDRPAEGPIFAGAAREEITPAVATPLAGYGNRLGRASRGVHDRLYTRALAMRVGDRVVILVASDLLAMTDDITRAVERLVRREIPLQPQSLILTATHTHSGFGAVARRVVEGFAAGEYDERIFRALTERIARAAIEAYRALAPAEIAWGEATAPEFIANRMIPDGFVDPAVPYLAIRRIDHTPVASLVNFSAHPTVLKSDNFLLSGDFPGAMARDLEADGAPALYTAGAVADQTAVAPRAADRFAAVEAMGRELASRVRASIDSLAPAAWTARAPLGAWRLDLPLPDAQVKTSPHRRLPTPVANLFFDRRTWVEIVVIGDRVLIGVPCDLSAQIGAAWKAEAARIGRRAVILGFANDYVGYVIPSEYYETAHYEAKMSFNGPAMDRYLTAIVSRAMARLGPLARGSE